MGFKTDERFIAPRVKTTKEMLEEFAYLGEEKAFETVVENPNMIAGKAEEGFPPFEENAFYSADIEELIDKVNKKLKEKYGENIPPECLERVERELSLLENIEKNVYNLLISSKLVGCAADQGWTVGSRGSVASSFVAYLLGITGINPLEAHYYCPKCHYVEFHNEYYCGADLEDKFCGCGAKLEKDGFTVPYETFFGTEGDREIDIDLNFPAEYQNEAFDRLEKVTGLKTVRCGSIGTVPYKTARAMVSRYCKKEGLTIGKKRMEAMVEKLSQVKMTSGIHPGGVFVIPEGKDIYDYTPIQYPADTREILTTHFDYNALEGLLKVDLLPHDAPSLLKRLEEATGVDPKSIPLDDKETLKLFEERKTSGIPEFDSEFVLKRVMNKKKKYSFDDLIRISGLSHGTNTWTENGEELIAKGREFSDIVSCRDDVTLYLISRGLERKEAFGISERVRKGRGMSPEQYDALLNRGVEKERLDSWNKIKYSFPRAHAAAYVLLAFRIAYYKAHFPQEFEKILKSFH